MRVDSRCQDTFMKVPYIEALKNIALVFTSPLIAFCLAEILVRLFITVPIVGPLIKVNYNSLSTTTIIPYFPWGVLGLF